MAKRLTRRKKYHPKSFLSVPEVQSYLGVKSRKTILKYIRGGLLHAFKLGGTRWRIAEKDVEAFLDLERNGNGDG